MQIILNDTDYKNIRGEFESNDSFLVIPVFRSTNIHPRISPVSFYYIGVLNSDYTIKSEWIYNITHYDIPYRQKYLIGLDTKNIFTSDRKQLRHHLSNCHLYDINLLVYLKSEDFSKIQIEPTTHLKLYNKTGNNDIIPIATHINNLNAVVNRCLTALQTFHGHLEDKDYVHYNDYILHTLSFIEATGIPVDKEVFREVYPEKVNNHLVLDHQTRVYSEYNIYTSTGRPSNKFGQVNFAALNKKNREREWIVSGHGEHGTLVEFDYTAYHLTILAKIIGYDVNGVNMHEFLGKQYFDTDTLSEEQYKETKILNFKNLYGYPDKEILDKVPYFQQVQKLAYLDYETYKEKGYVHSVISNRKIRNVESVTANKLLNYSLQLYETEISMMLLRELISFIEEKRINILLYTYDSVLLDIHKDEVRHIKELQNILSNDGEFLMTMKTSTTNYREIA